MSLTNLGPVHSKQATRLFKNILGYMGDRQLAYPTQLAQEFIQQGLETPEIRDELYSQIMKQLTDNPAPYEVNLMIAHTPQSLSLSLSLSLINFGIFVASL
jgi:hypothetical protein